jgi:P4 family phage/plasmid primase-like protien
VQNQDYTLSTDFLKRFFGETLQDIELRACSNDRSGGAMSVFGRDTAAMDAFLRKRDTAGWGMYFGLCTRGHVQRDGKRSGAKDNVAECPALWVDIDCAKQGISGADAIAALDFLPFPPTIVVNSGGGLHAYWLLEEAVDVSPGQPVRATIEAALRQLALILAGDTACAELARILRLPGTHNTKDATLALNDGAAALCEVLSDNGRVYDLESLCEWLDEQRPILHGKVEAARPVKLDDPYVAYAREAGYEPAIDINAELAAMNHGAIGGASIHETQLRVSMSMIARGYDDDEIVARVLSATEAAAPGDKKWNWGREEASIRKMVSTGRAKVTPRERPVPAAPMAANGNAALKLVPDMPEERAKLQKPKPSPRENVDQITALGTAVLEVWQDRHGPIIHSRGTSYVYEDGVWAVWDDQHDQILRIMMQEACSSLGLAPKTGLITAATLFFANRPSLLIRDAQFDEHPLIIAGDGTVNPASGETGEHSPDHRAMFKVGANLDGKRDCPAFLQFLEESFADKDADEIPDIIRTVQEWFGACLVANKSRALCKGLLVHGGSRTGKTQLSEVLRALLGRGQTSATSAGDIGTDFGLQGFLGKRGWVADDAIGQDEYLDAERYKKIVTGEEVGVRRKNRVDIMARFGFPVMLTANHLPKIKDQSDAVYNRSLVLQMTNVRPESKPEPSGYHSISAKIIAEELTGVLWWAIEGWQRLSARGVFTEPACMKRAVGEMQNNNNQVGSWIKECVVADTENKVANADLFASFAGWYYQENGDGKFPWSQNGFIRRLKEAMPNLGYQKGVKTRNLTGLRLTEDGLEYWSVNDSRDHPACPKGASLDGFSVNQSFSVSHVERQKLPEIPAQEDRTPRF